MKFEFQDSHGNWIEVEAFGLRFEEYKPEAAEPKKQNIEPVTITVKAVTVSPQCYYLIYGYPFQAPHHAIN